MKSDKKSGTRRGSFCRVGNTLAQGARLAAAGYPKFLFRLAAARRSWVGLPAAPRRHD
jgi:hypothetical protein